MHFFSNFHFNEIKYMKSDLPAFLAVIMAFFFCHTAAVTLKDFGGL